MKAAFLLSIALAGLLLAACSESHTVKTPVPPAPPRQLAPR